MLELVKVEKRNREMPKATTYQGRYYRVTGRDWQAYNSKPRIYAHPDDYSVLENLSGRYSRPFQAVKAEVIPAIWAQLGEEPIKAVWSQKAGCSCGCSPAFILQDEGKRYDIWAEYRGGVR